MKRPTHSALSAGLVAVLILVGCSTAAPLQTPGSQPPATPAAPASSPQASPATPGASPWDAELANVQSDGTRSLESSLRLFAMAFGPIPGVDAPQALKGSIGSASPAVRAILAHRAELTPEQQTAVDGYLDVPADAKTLEIAPASPASPSPSPAAQRQFEALRGGSVAKTQLDVRADADSRPYTNLEQEIAQEAQQARTSAARHFGDIPKLDIRLWNGGNEFLTFFNPVFDGANFLKCDVVVNTSAANDDRFQTRRAMALDIAHCFQSWRLGSDVTLEGTMPGWAWEGPAEYILLETFPAQQADAVAWQTYIQSPTIPLFERTYDAVGYWAQVQWNGIDIDNAMVAVLADVDNPTRFNLAGTGVAAFTDNWASQLTRQAWGREWDITGPAVPGASTAAPQQPMTVTTGSLEAVSEPPFTNKVYALTTSSDFVHFAYSGRGRVGDGSVNVNDLVDTWFCTNPEACGDCPDGSPLPFDWAALNARALFAASGGVDGTGGTVSGHSKEEFCKKTPQACPDGPQPQTGVPGAIALVGGGVALVANESCKTPEPSDDAFCPLYRDYVAWAQSQGGGDMTKPLAAEIANRFIAMHAVAPDELIDDVEVMVDVYSAFADLPDPFNVPGAGHAGAEKIPSALKAMNAYCGVEMPGL